MNKAKALVEMNNLIIPIYNNISNIYPMVSKDGMTVLLGHLCTRECGVCAVWGSASLGLFEVHGTLWTSSPTCKDMIEYLPQTFGSKCEMTTRLIIYRLKRCQGQANSQAESYGLQTETQRILAFAPLWREPALSWSTTRRRLARERKRCFSSRSEDGSRKR
jgi:hypothetical protein